MDAVVKVGGSLAENPNPQALKTLATELGSTVEKYQIAVVPGGGKFADAVRELDSKFNLPAAISHRMAILAMDQFGLLLSQLTPKSQTCSSLKDAQKISKIGRVAILLPSNLFSTEDPFEPSWDVTSDSIAAYLAIKLHAPQLVLVTDVDGIFTENPKENTKAKLLGEVSTAELLKLKKRTSVDLFLPKFLSQNPLTCHVINGNYPERLAAVLSGKETVGTKIVA